MISNYLTAHSVKFGNGTASVEEHNRKGICVDAAVDKYGCYYLIILSDGKLYQRRFDEVTLEQ